MDSPRLRLHLWRGAALIAVAVSLVGCATSSSTQAPGSTAGPVQSASVEATPGPALTASASAGGEGVEAARKAIDAANLGDSASLAAVDAIRLTDDGAAAAAEVLSSGATGDRLWAATLVYATSGTDPNVLAPAMADSDPTVKSIAAAALLSWGNADAAGVLASLLAVDGSLRGGEPPVSISAFASATLARFIDGPVVAADAQPADRAAVWTTWLDAHRSTMQFDPETGRWRAQ